MRQTKLQKEKTKQVILYFLNKLGQLEKEKLMMLLYFYSFDFFEKYGKHSTGLTFIK